MGLLNRSNRNQTFMDQRTSHYDGFSLLELVVAVSIMLILVVVGFILFQNFTDNARQSAVERAASDVFTAAMSADTMPNGTPLSEIEQAYNESSDDAIHVEIDKDTTTQDLTVTATGWDNRYIAVRSTNLSQDGNTTPPLEDEESPEGFTGDINDYENGQFTFSTGNSNSLLYFSNVSDNAFIEGGSIPDEKPLKDGFNTLDGSGTFTIRGGFETLGFDLKDTMEKILNEEELTPEEEQAVINLDSSPFISPDASIETWENTGTTSIAYAFALSQFNSSLPSPPTTVTNMSGAFYKASFNQDISHWDVSNVTDMSRIFEEARNFNNGGAQLSWGDKTQNVKDMTGMFASAHVFDQDVSGWNTSSVENMSAMFASAHDFDQDLSNWTVSSVENMRGMFSDASQYNNGGNPLNWESTSNVTDMSEMFTGATSFNQDVSSWDTSSLKDVSYMFAAAMAFDRDLSGWDVADVTRYENFAWFAPIENDTEKLPDFS